LSLIFAKESDELPGSEITEEEYLKYITPQDSIQKNLPVRSPQSKTWLDNVSDTWDAPPLAIQLAEDKKALLLGMGAVFIPYMSDPELEPDIEIINNTGKVAVSGKPGSKFNLVPDQYHIILGSGSHQQKIVKNIFVAEGKLSPIFPDWCGLAIDVVDKDNQPFRGEYELARIDTFETFGRGYGRNQELGEKLKTWILKPGVYKIYGVGESYNTLTNFVTVRLLPGEFVRFILVENDENDMIIIGGGTVQIKPESEITPKWKYKINAGGGIDFNYKSDRQNDTVEIDQTNISIQFTMNLNYKNNIYEWNNRLQFDEGVTFYNFTDFNIVELQSSVDEVRLTSIFTWRVLPWLGPYSRSAFETGIVSKHVRKPKVVDDYYFISLNKNLLITEIDSSRKDYLIQPSFSPIIFESGIGVNFNILNTRYFEARALTGIGFTYGKSRNEYRIGDDREIKDSTIDGHYNQHFEQCSTIVKNKKGQYSIIIDKEIDRPDVGPEILLNFIIRLGRFGIIESEPEFFLPFSNFDKPHINWSSILSWRIAKMVTLDYEFKLSYIQAEEDDSKQNESRHRINIRFSYTSK
jgi:hypothetical protein